MPLGSTNVNVGFDRMEKSRGQAPTVGKPRHHLHGLGGFKDYSEAVRPELSLFLDRGRPVDDDGQRRHVGLLGRRVHQESLAILRHGVHLACGDLLKLSLVARL